MDGGPPEQGDTVYVQWHDESGRPVRAASGVWRAHPGGGARLYVPGGDEDYPDRIGDGRVTVYDRADEYMRLVELAALALASHDELGGGMTDSPAWYVRSGAAAVAIGPVWEVLQRERRRYAGKAGDSWKDLHDHEARERRKDRAEVAAALGLPEGAAWPAVLESLRSLVATVLPEGPRFGRADLETLVDALWLPLHPQDDKAVATIADAVRTRHRRLCKAAGVPVDTSPPVLAGHVCRLAKSAKWQDERTRERLDMFRHALADVVGVGHDRSWDELSREIRRLVEDRSKLEGYRDQLAQEAGIPGDSTWAELNRAVARLVDDRKRARAEVDALRAERDKALSTLDGVRRELAAIRMVPTEIAGITAADPVRGVRRLGEQYRAFLERARTAPAAECWEALREALGLPEGASSALMVTKAREAAEAVQAAADRAESFEGAARVAGAEYARVWMVANRLLAWYHEGHAPSAEELDAAARELDPYAEPPASDEVPRPARGFLFALSPDARRHAVYNGSDGSWFAVESNPRGRFVPWREVQDWTVFAPGRAAVVPESVADLVDDGRIVAVADVERPAGSTPQGVVPSVTGEFRFTGDDPALRNFRVDRVSTPAPDPRPVLPSALWDLAREWSSSGVAELDEGRAVALSDLVAESAAHKARQEAGRELARVLEAVARTPEAAHEPQRVWSWDDYADRTADPRCPVVDSNGVLWSPEPDGRYRPHFAAGTLRDWQALLRASGRLLEVVRYFTPPAGWANRIDEVLWFQGLRDAQYRNTSWALSNLVRSWIGTWAYAVDFAPDGAHWGPRTPEASDLEVGEIGLIPERFRWHRAWSRPVDADRFEVSCHDCDHRRVGVGLLWELGERQDHALTAEPVLVDSTKPQVFVEGDLEPHTSVTAVRAPDGSTYTRVPVDVVGVFEPTPGRRVAWCWRASRTGALVRWRDALARAGHLVEVVHGVRS